MKRFLLFLFPFHDPEKCGTNLFCSYKIWLLVFSILISSKSFAQLPDATSCTSKDLELVGASLPPDQGENVCDCDGDRFLKLTINNKTGSTRTSFALWGTLVRYDASGTETTREPIFACAGPIPSSSITTLTSTKLISVHCDESLEIQDLFLAWTSANKKETCDVLEANPGGISPKCGTLPKIRIEIGVDADLLVNNHATCLTGGSIKVSPWGGVGPYEVAIDGGAYQPVPTSDGYLIFTNLSAGAHNFSIKDSRNCEKTKSQTIASPTAVTASAGDGGTIGICGKTFNIDASGTGTGTLSYAWSGNGAQYLNDTAIEDPVFTSATNGSYSLTLTVTDSNGCTATDDVTIVVDPAPEANAGLDGNIGECEGQSFTVDATTSGTELTFAWTGNGAGYLDDPSIEEPTFSGAANGTYTLILTVTDKFGCEATDQLDVVVDPAPEANAGTGFTKTCTAYKSGGTIGEAAVSGFSYSWTSIPAGFSSTEANPTVNPATTTTYTVRKTKISSGCYDDDDVTVTVDNDVPDAPIICVDEPSLCGDGLGTITILSPSGTAGEYAYSIDDGVSYTNDKLVWTGLAAGSNPQVKVMNVSTGCESSAADCGDSNCGSQEPALTGTEILNSETMQLSQSEIIEAVLEPENEVNTLKSSTMVQVEELARIEPAASSELGVKAYPNPFSDQVKFEVTVPETGDGSLELTNMMGQKIKIIYQGRMNAGINSYEVSLPVTKSATLIYTLRLGDKQLTGKLLQITP